LLIIEIEKLRDDAGFARSFSTSSGPAEMFGVENGARMRTLPSRLSRLKISIPFFSFIGLSLRSARSADP
jgi:hypothetical protein